jgi:hypothetical protein
MLVRSGMRRVGGAITRVEIVAELEFWTELEIEGKSRVLERIELTVFE